MIWLHPHQRSTVSKLVRRHREGGKVGGGEGGAKSYDGKKARSSINHSILSALNPVFTSFLAEKEKGGGGGGAKSYDGKKARPSINHSILSVLTPVLPILG
jgi:hypothetical protein